jgi:single-stranded DNA-binding protein
MNSCVLMAKIVRSPQLRYLQENQLAVTDMMVEFDSGIPNRPPCTLKVVAWGNLATDIQQQYHEGNQVILTGRLKMDLQERQGYKEKVAELTISHIYPLQEGSTTPPSNVVNINNYQSDGDDDLDYDSESIEGVNLDDMPF